MVEATRRIGITRRGPGLLPDHVQLPDHGTVQPLRIPELAAAEVEPHRRMFDRPVPFPVDRQAAEQLPVALEEFLERVDQEALPEAPGGAKGNGISPPSSDAAHGPSCPRSSSPSAGFPGAIGCRRGACAFPYRQIRPPGVRGQKASQAAPRRAHSRARDRHPANVVRADGTDPRTKMAFIAGEGRVSGLREEGAEPPPSGPCRGWENGWAVYPAGQAVSTEKATMFRSSRLNSTPIRWTGRPRFHRGITGSRTGEAASWQGSATHNSTSGVRGRLPKGTILSALPIRRNRGGTGGRHTSVACAALHGWERTEWVHTDRQCDF